MVCCCSVTLAVPAAASVALPCHAAAFPRLLRDLCGACCCFCSVTLAVRAAASASCRMTLPQVYQGRRPCMHERGCVLLPL
eukprot:365738-Chlamydomonas_euryale.AAC.4